MSRTHIFLMSWKVASNVQQKKVAALKFKGFEIFDRDENYIALQRKYTFVTIFKNGEQADGLPIRGE